MRDFMKTISLDFTRLKHTLNCPNGVYCLTIHYQLSFIISNLTRIRTINHTDKMWEYRQMFCLPKGCFGLWLMVFNATFNNISVCRGGQFYWWRKPEYLEKITDLSQVTDEFYHTIICYQVHLKLP
jgi:hypothetical protein